MYLYLILPQYLYISIIALKYVFVVGILIEKPFLLFSVTHPFTIVLC